MEFRILGSLEVADERGPVQLPSGRARSLITLLILHAGQPMTAERLIDELWGADPPATATTVVQGLVSRLRKALEPDRGKGAPGEILQTIGPAYRLAIEPADVDAHRFTDLVQRAREADAEARASMLAAALRLWRGPALADFTYEPFAQRTIAALEQRRVDAVELRFETELALGRDTALIGDLEAAIAEHPFRERLRALLMIALYRAGRQAEALDAYRATRTFLLDEMALEPGPELRELEGAILRQDPTLEIGAAPHVEHPSWIPHERRRVTVVAVDVTPDIEREADAETMARMGDQASAVATEVLQRHGARVERSIGDKVVAFFGFPMAREDDPLRAVKAALDVRTAVHGLEDPPRPLRFRARAGIESGEVIVGPGASLAETIRGPLLSTADNLLHAGGDGDVLVGPGVQGLLRGAVIVRPASVPDQRSHAWRVLEVVPAAHAIPRTFDAPLVGRGPELSRLRSAFRRARSTGSAVAMTLLGDAGIGKSRLARELVATLVNDARAIVIRCSPPGDAMGFFPVRQAVVEAAGIDGWRHLHGLLADAHDGTHTAPEVADGISLRSPPADAGELLAPLRVLFEALARERPLIVVLEDLHWADVAFRETIEALERQAVGPIFLLCLSRTDEHDDGPSIGERAKLEPLDSGDIARLAVERATSLAEQSLARIVHLSQGNPLFAEQLLAAIGEEGLEAVPPSLAGLLSARLDRLGPGQRDVLRVASVAGLEAEIDVVEALLPEHARPFLQRHLDTLEHRRLIQRVPPRSLRFAHALIHMAAVQTMTRDDRESLRRALSRYLDHATEKGPALTP